MRNVILAAACLLVALPARAEVVATGDAGFVVRHAVEVTAGKKVVIRTTAPNDVAP